MTQQNVVEGSRQADALHPQSDSADAIKITPAMIEAGVKIVRAFNYDFWETHSIPENAEFVKCIFSAMKQSSQDGNR